jgi:hypothetical protein
MLVLKNSDRLIVGQKPEPEPHQSFHPVPAPETHQHDAPPQQNCAVRARIGLIDYDLRLTTNNFFS